MVSARQNWTREEHIVAFNLYCKIPFSKINSSYPPIIALARILDRSNGSVAMKMANFARLDPALQARNISGLSRGAKGEEEVWKEFNGNWDELAYHSEKILADFKKEKLEESTQIEIDDITVIGDEREAVVKTRVKQSFFRKTVLASYNYSCCITGISNQELLIASHIVPWKDDKFNRVNPCNGLCLNALHDKAFDRGLLTVTPDFKIILSDSLLSQKSSSRVIDYFSSYHNQKIIHPQKFLPNPEFLHWHNINVFQE